MGRFIVSGLTVGCLDNTEPGTPERREAYECDITYGTNNEFGFDYLRDNMASSPEQLVQRELNYAVIDEVDNILIDEARTPLIISGPVTKSNREYEELKPRVERLVNAQTQLMQKVLGKRKSSSARKARNTSWASNSLLSSAGLPKNISSLSCSRKQGVSKFMKTVETDFLREKKLHEIDEELFYIIDESGHSAETDGKGPGAYQRVEPGFFRAFPICRRCSARSTPTRRYSPEEKAARRRRRIGEYCRPLRAHP